MKTTDDLEYDYAERMAIMTENGKSEVDARIEATYQVRKDMVDINGLDFATANIKVMGIRRGLTNNQDVVI